MGDELEAIWRVTNAATEGPWDYQHGPDGEKTITAVNSTFPIAVVYLVPGNAEATEDNARFIAQARETVPFLVAEIDRLQRENAALRAMLERLGGAQSIAKVMAVSPGMSTSEAAEWIDKFKTESQRELAPTQLPPESEAMTVEGRQFTPTVPMPVPLPAPPSSAGEGEE